MSLSTHAKHALRQSLGYQAGEEVARVLDSLADEVLDLIPSHGPEHTLRLEPVADPAPVVAVPSEPVVPADAVVPVPVVADPAPVVEEVTPVSEVPPAEPAAA